MRVAAQHSHQTKTDSHQILLVDQHPAAREGLALRLEQDHRFQVCGEAGDVVSVLPLVVATQPDVVVMDVALRGGSGIDLIRRLREQLQVVRVLVWSRYREVIYAERVIRAGAAGYIEKGHPTVDVVAAIHHVLAGKIYLSPTMTDVALRHRGNGVASDPVAALSDRELEVFRMIGLCHDTQQIAKDLHLSEKTVETYRGRIKAKFGARSSAELLRLAVHWELENG